MNIESFMQIIKHNHNNKYTAEMQKNESDYYSKVRNRNILLDTNEQMKNDCRKGKGSHHHFSFIKKFINLNIYDQQPPQSISLPSRNTQKRV